MATSCLLLGQELWAAKTKTLIYCSEGSPSNFNPQLATDGTSFTANARVLHSHLIDVVLGETTLVPGLVESWEISKDGLVYTFKLRQGVRFHTTKYFRPTREFNADDVLFTFNRQRLKEHPYHKVGGGVYNYFESMSMGKLIKDIVKVDDHTIKFILTRREAPFLANLTMDFAGILSAEYGAALLKAKTPEKMDMFPIGTGPFRFKRYEKDSLIRYEAHPDYFRGKTPIDNLVFIITPDASVRTQKLKTGECHIIGEPAATDLQMFKRDPKLRVLQRTGLNTAYLALNVEKPPFHKVKVRRAVNHALNRKAYLDAVYLGNATQAKSALPPTIWGYHEALQEYEYNPQRARELLAEAGHADGFTTDLWALPVSRPYIPNGKKLAEMMQADLAKVGIKAKIVSYDWPTYLAKSKLGEHSMLQLGWTSDNGDPDNFLGTLLSCAAVMGGVNRARWCYKPFDDLIQLGKITAERNERIKYYRRAQEIFKSEAPWVAIAHSTIFRATSKEVVDFKINPFGPDLFYGVGLQ